MKGLVAALALAGGIILVYAYRRTGWVPRRTTWVPIAPDYYRDDEDDVPMTQVDPHLADLLAEGCEDEWCSVCLDRHGDCGE